MSARRARILFICAAIIYGTIGPVLRLINALPEVIVLIRGFVGVATLALVLYIQHRPLDRQGIADNLLWLVATGVCLGFNWVALFAAYRYTSVAVASLCNYTAPVVVIVLATIFFHEHLSALKVGCVVAAALGIVCVSGIIGTDLVSLGVRGIALGMAAALGFVGILICNRFVGKVEIYSRVLVQLSAATLVTLIYVLSVHHGVFLPHDMRSWALAIMLGVIHTGLAYILWFGPQQVLPLQEIALLGYLEPVVSVLLSALVLAEPLGALGILGAVLIIGAAVVSELAP